MFIHDNVNFCYMCPLSRKCCPMSVFDEPKNGVRPGQVLDMSRTSPRHVPDKSQTSPMACPFEHFFVRIKKSYVELKRAYLMAAIYPSLCSV